MQHNHASKVGGSDLGEAQIKGAREGASAQKRFEGEARIEGEALERAGEGSRVDEPLIWCIVEWEILKYSRRHLYALRLPAYFGLLHRLLSVPIFQHCI